MKVLWINPANPRRFCIVKFMGTDATCDEAIIDIGDFDLEWVQFDQLVCWRTKRPLKDVLAELQAA